MGGARGGNRAGSSRAAVRRRRTAAGRVPCPPEPARAGQGTRWPPSTSAPRCCAPSSWPRPRASRPGPTPGSAACCWTRTARVLADGLPPRCRHPARRGRRAGAGRVGGRRQHRGRHPRAVQPHRPHRPVRAGAARRRGRAGGLRPGRPQPGRVRRGRRPARGRGRRRGRAAGRAGRRAQRDLDLRAGARPPVRHLEARGHAWTAAVAAADGTQPVDHLRAGRADVHALRARVRRRPRRHRHGAGRRPAADRPRRRRPPGRAPAAARGGGPAAAPGGRPAAGRLRADARLPDRIDLAAVLADLHGRDVQHVLLEGGPTLAGAFLRAGLVDRGRGLPGAGAARRRTGRRSATPASPRSRRRCGCTWRTSPPSGRTCGSPRVRSAPAPFRPSTQEVTSHVHRHRRGARRGRRGRRPRRRGPAHRPRAARHLGRRSRRLDRGQRGVPDRGGHRERGVHRRRDARDAAPDQPRRAGGRAARSTWSGR